jgi:hypothetical protein
MTGLRLWLIGDDEVLDLLAELSRHLDYVEIARVDESPESLGPEDHVVLAYLDRPRAPNELARLLAHQAPGFATVVSHDEDDSPGTRAIVVAADLVAAIHARR